MIVGAAVAAKVAAGNPVAGLLILAGLGFGVWLGCHHLVRRGGWQATYSGHWPPP